MIKAIEDVVMQNKKTPNLKFLIEKCSMWNIFIMLGAEDRQKGPF